jgi:SAM-dependent methyltransferase
VNIFDYVNRSTRLPEGETEKSIYSYLSSYAISDADNKQEVINYLKGDFKRFVHTLSIVPNGNGNLLEVGANPYYMSMLLRKFRMYKAHFTNYFEGCSDEFTQYMIGDCGEKIEFNFHNIDIERQSLPFGKEYFDVILFCEVLEHMSHHPVQALLNIKRCLKHNGHLILTTPNVNRLENVARMLQGNNIYDPFSKYGIHGRHNREYNKHELWLLLTHLGFEIEEMFSADGHINVAESYYPLDELTKALLVTKNREHDLGQYIFIRARNVGSANDKLPYWLYNSYPSEMISEP